MNGPYHARLAQLEAAAAHQRTRQAERQTPPLPDDPAELRRRYLELRDGPPDPELAGLSPVELVARFRRLVWSTRSLSE